jgi:hypothetical protein
MTMHLYAAIYTVYRPVRIFGFEFFVVNGSAVSHIECAGVMTPKTLDDLSKTVRLPERKTVLTSVASLGTSEGGDINSWTCCD